MRCADIISRLMERLPAQSALFSDYLTPESVGIAGNVVTVVKEKHGLSTGQIVSVSNAVTLTPVTAIETGDGVTCLTTGTAHDLTEEYHTHVTLSSAGTPEANGVYPLTSVNGRFDIEVTGEIDDEIDDLVLHETRELTINGLFRITKIDNDSFRYDLPEAIGTASAILASSVRVHHRLRISGGASIERIIENYEKQAVGQMWAFVVLDGTAINKDRNSNSDMDMEQGGGNNWNGLLLSPFSVYVFVPCENEITGRAARDTCEDLRVSLYKSLLGAKFDTGFCSAAESGVIPRGDEMLAYMKAFYVHRFQFTQGARIGIDDTSSAPVTVALRQIDFDWLKESTENEGVMISGSVSLDTPETE